MTAADANTIRSGLGTGGQPGQGGLGAEDDFSALTSLNFDLNFFGFTTRDLFVNNNGSVTLDRRLDAFTTVDLTSTGRQIIAPFFADVDTRGTYSSTVTFGNGMVDGRNAFGVNWVNVGFYNSQSNLLNSFQLVLIDRLDTGAGNFDIEFNYGDILWETGDFSGGSNGRGGFPARAGFSNGTGDAGSFFELQGSAVQGAFLNGGANALSTGSNIGEAGRFLFNARNGTVMSPPEPSVVPLPAGVILLLSGVAAVSGSWRRRKG